MLIEVYSDVVCPWCYIGERRLEAALARRSELQIEKRWRPFQLRPEMPAGGEDWATFAREKFGGVQRAQAAFSHVTTVVAADGLRFNFDRVASAPNTVDAHRLILLARNHDREWEMADALFAAYFADGRNLNDEAQLLAIAGDVGLDAETVRSYLHSDEGRDDVSRSQIEAGRLGITGVPFYVIDGRLGLSGAQPVDVFLRAIDAAQSPELMLRS
jgi:predicted DsbA family dithiol-disulfide isomerase